MINWFRSEYYSEYRGRLLNAFPNALKDDVEAVLNILPFNINNVRLADGQIHKVDNLIHPFALTVELGNELLIFPYRLYFNEPDAESENKLSELQKTILNCIYLRHHDGYLRQRRLEKLINKNQDWVTPFKLQLLGEYVFEILEVLDKHINDESIASYIKIMSENPKYWQQTESRMISYWNEYYRWRFPNIRKYLGRQIVDRIKKANA
ncbi:MAG: hypothetical protein JWP58_922 [Hymenobacter sp.]|nr:hypothetical protein [Hymenobacter sp.]